MVGIPSPRLHPALSATTYWPRFTGTLVRWSWQEGRSQRKLWSLSPGSTQGSWAKYLSKQLSVQKRPFQSHCLPEVVHSAQDPDATWVTHKACDLQVSLITQIGRKKKNREKQRVKSDPTIPLLSMHPKKVKPGPPKDTYIPTFSTELVGHRIQNVGTIQVSMEKWSDRQHFVPMYHAALCSHTKFRQLLHSGWTLRTIC